MVRSFLLSLGWLLAGAVLYAGLVGLELYWNLYDWEPRYDWRGAAILGQCFIAELLIVLLSRATRHRASRAVALLVCLALAVLGFYVLPAEPMTQGLFARQETSPGWYRLARLLLLLLPAGFWTWNIVVAKRKRRSFGSAPGSNESPPDRTGAQSL